MSHGRQGSSYRSGPARRKSSWEIGPGRGRVTITASTTPMIIGVGGAASEDGLTLARLRGDLYVRMIAAAASGDIMSGWVGIGITSTQGFAIGVTAVPTPVTELAEENWIWMHHWSVEAVQDAEVLNRGGLGGYHVPIDTKSMRKLNIGDVMYAAVEASSTSGTPVASFELDTRALVLLP